MRQRVEVAYRVDGIVERIEGELLVENELLIKVRTSTGVKWIGKSAIIALSECGGVEVNERVR